MALPSRWRPALAALFATEAISLGLSASSLEKWSRAQPKDGVEHCRGRVGFSAAYAGSKRRLMFHAFQVAGDCNLGKRAHAPPQQSVGHPNPAFKWRIPAFQFGHWNFARGHGKDSRFATDLGFHKLPNPSDGNKSQKVAEKGLTVNCVLL
jgi:hypothetical protein